MKIGTIMITAGIVALGLASWTPGKAQGPMYDRVNVNLPYSVTIGDRTLQPGDYVIQQLRDEGGGSRVLLIYSDNGMKFETSAMTIPALEANGATPEKTSVVLGHLGNDYYFDKVWIQGKDYGYQFPVPNSLKAREKERTEPVAVGATYSSTPQSATQTTTTSQATTAAETPATAAATTEPATTSNTMTAQSQPSTTQEPATTRSTAAPATTPSTAAATPQTNENTANRSMPETSAGWLMMLLSGGALSSVGYALRRKQ
jgi:hypothetical protein